MHSFSRLQLCQNGAGCGAWEDHEVPDDLALLRAEDLRRDLQRVHAEAVVVDEPARLPVRNPLMRATDAEPSGQWSSEQLATCNAS